MYLLEHSAMVSGEKAQEVQVGHVHVLGAHGDGCLACCGFMEVVGRVGVYSSCSGSVAHVIVQSQCCLLVLVSNSPFSLLP